MDANWNDKLAAQQRHEHLAATVRIAMGELCWVAEQADELKIAEPIYGIVDMLEAQLKAGDVAYTDREVVGSGQEQTP
jgi:hypothetical protein